MYHTKTVKVAKWQIINYGKNRTLYLSSLTSYRKRICTFAIITMEPTPESSLRRALSFIWKIDEENDAPLVTTAATATATSNKSKDPTNNKNSQSLILDKNEQNHEEGSSGTTAGAVTTLPQHQQKQNLTISRTSDGNENNKNKKGRTAADLWERYDLTEGINSRDMWELQRVEKQVYKRPKLVPYNGINTVVN
jgi:hypothetical protein